MSDDLQRENAELNDRLLASYNELAALAGSLAHEIKNPLSVIRMNMDLLGEDLAELKVPGVNRAVAKVDVVRNQCTRLENLLNEAAGSQRMLSHGLGDPTLPNWLEDAEYQVKELGIDGWKFDTGNPGPLWRLAVVGGLSGALCLVAAGARAEVASDRAAAIVIFLRNRGALTA